MGKGSDRRPMDKTRCAPEEFRNRWDQIFGPTKLEKQIEKKIEETNNNETK
jgi:hypothetical protein